MPPHRKAVTIVCNLKTLLMQNCSPDVLPLKTAFEKILSTEEFGTIAHDIAELIVRDSLNLTSFEQLLNEHGLTRIHRIKHNVLDLIICYINLILEDNYITKKEAENVAFLKRFFKVAEGHFYHLKYFDVERIIDRQLSQMYFDGKIDCEESLQEESLQKVELQQLFDLGYDQFLTIADKAVRNALARGADPMELDTFIRPE